MKISEKSTIAKRSNKNRSILTYHQKRNSLVFLSVIGILLLSGVFTSCDRVSSLLGKDAEVEDLPVIDTVSQATDYTALIAGAVPVQEIALRNRIQGFGTVQGKQEAVLRAKFSGTINSIQFELGDELVEGQTVATLDNTVVSLNVSQLERQYKTAVADVASKELLYNRGSLPLIQLSQAKAALDGITAQLTQAQQSVKDTEIKSPITGRVSEKSRDLVIGDLLTAGQQIGRVIDLSQLQIRLSLGQEQLFLMRTGLEATILIETPSGSIETTGVVSAISAGSDSRTGSWTALIDFPNPDMQNIRSGISAEVIIMNPDMPPVLTVPEGALVLRNAQTSIFVVDGDAVKKVPIEILDRYGDIIAVKSLDPGMSLKGKSVLISGLSRLQNYETATEGAAQGGN